MLINLLLSTFEAAVLTALNASTGTDMGLINASGADRLQTEAGVRIVQAGNMRSEMFFIIGVKSHKNG
jgi:hypothetical protein